MAQVSWLMGKRGPAQPWVPGEQCSSIRAWARRAAGNFCDPFSFLFLPKLFHHCSQIAFKLFQNWTNIDSKLFTNWRNVPKYVTWSQYYFKGSRFVYKWYQYGLTMVPELFPHGIKTYATLSQHCFTIVPTLTNTCWEFYQQCPSSIFKHAPKWLQHWTKDVLPLCHNCQHRDRLRDHRDRVHGVGVGMLRD